MFKNALEVVDEALRAYEDMRTRESSEFSRVGLVSVTIVSEVLTKIKSLVTTLSTIEANLESSRPAILKLCEGLTYVSSDQTTSVIHRSPLATVSYNSKEGEVSVSNKHLSITLRDKTLEIKFRSHTTSINLLNKEDLEKHANLIKALASEKLQLISYLMTITESCRKKLGLR
ncbi:MAG: hypothetical protein QW417_05410 [Zestosphaera sp.]